jgi:hypothetical protein
MGRDLAARVSRVRIRDANLSALLVALGPTLASVTYDKGARYDGRSRVGPAGLAREALGSLALTGALTRALATLGLVGAVVAAGAAAGGHGQVIWLAAAMACVCVGGALSVHLGVRRRLQAASETSGPTGPGPGG